MESTLIDLENNGNPLSLSEILTEISNCQDPERLNRYARHDNLFVLSTIARYTKLASLGTYLLLADSEERQILQCLTLNVNLPSEVYLFIWEKHIYAPLDKWKALENIFTRELVSDDVIRKSLHYYMDIYEEEGDDTVRSRVEMLSMLSLSKCLSTQDMNRLLSYGENDIIDNVVWNKKLDFDMVISIANAGNFNAQEAAFDRRHELIQYLQKTGGNDFDYNSLNKDWVSRLLGWK